MNFSLDEKEYFIGNPISEQYALDIICNPYTIKKSGTAEIGRSIMMHWGPGFISLDAQLQVEGDAVTPSTPEYIKRAIEKTWDTHIGSVKIRCCVNVYTTNSKVLNRAHQWIICNKKVSDDRDGAAHVHMNYGIRNAFMCLAMEGEYSIIRHPVIIAHEFGHLLGLWDRYTEGRKKGKRVGKSYELWEGTLMADNGRLNGWSIMGLLYLYALENGQRYSEAHFDWKEYFRTRCVYEGFDSSILQTDKDNISFKNAAAYWQHRLLSNKVGYKW